MRNEAAITSISWIPSEAVRGLRRSTFDSGVAHYDPPPPGRLVGSDHLEELRRADRFRFANTLSAWVEVGDGEVVGHRSEGGGQIGSTSLALGSGDVHGGSSPQTAASPRRGRVLGYAVRPLVPLSDGFTELPGVTLLDRRWALRTQRTESHCGTDRRRAAAVLVCSS